MNIANPMELRDLIELVEYAASTDETRYNLNGVHLETDSDGTMAVPTDGHRLAAAHCKGLDLPLPEGGIIIPTAGIKALKKTLHRKQELMASGDVAITSKSLTLVCHGRPTAEVELEFDYPTWRNIVPPLTDCPHRITLKGGNTEHIAEAAEEMAAVGINPMVRVKMTSVEISMKKKCAIPGGNVTGAATFKINGDANTEFGVNGHYLAEALRNLHGDISLHVGLDDLRPIKLTDAHGSVAVIMPVRL